MRNLWYEKGLNYINLANIYHPETNSSAVKHCKTLKNAVFWDVKPSAFCKK
jgi:hypothetical protein